jgi:apolipoprotein N-acyltransferase
LPQPLAATLYARFGDGPAGLMVLAALALVLERRLRRTSLT